MRDRRLAKREGGEIEDNRSANEEARGTPRPIVQLCKPLCNRRLWCEHERNE